MTLRDRIVEHLAAHPGERAIDIAKAVTARLADVLAVLRDGETFESYLRASWPSDRARVYRLAAAAGERPGTAGGGVVRRPSQCERLIAILQDGCWHNSADLHRQVFCVLHSRIAELRRRGYVIERRGAGAGAEHYDYRLVGTSEAVAASGDTGSLCRDAVTGLSGPAAVASGVPDADTAPESEARALPAGTPEQLRIGEAA